MPLVYWRGITRENFTQSELADLLRRAKPKFTRVHLTPAELPPFATAALADGPRQSPKHVRGYSKVIMDQNVSESRNGPPVNLGMKGLLCDRRSVA
jgi:hypothetical protein